MNAIVQDDINMSVGGLDRFLRRRLLQQLAGFGHGRLTLRDAMGTVVIGTPASEPTDLDVQVDEKSTGSLNFQLGYSTASGVFGSLASSTRAAAARSSASSAASSATASSRSMTSDSTPSRCRRRTVSARLGRVAGT